MLHVLFQPLDVTLNTTQTIMIMIMILYLNWIGISSCASELKMRGLARYKQPKATNS